MQIIKSGWLNLGTSCFCDLKMTEQGYHSSLLLAKVSLSKSDLEKLISENRYKDKRAILLKVSSAELWDQIRKISVNELMATIYQIGWHYLQSFR